jgi:hypothetical protein
MTSVIYDSFFFDWANGDITPGVDSFKAMLVTSAYTPDKKVHTTTGSVTNEASGTGYTAGGAPITVGVTNDTTNDRCDIALGGYNWTSSAITARGVVYYQASNNKLVCYVDFGSDYVTTTGTFLLASSILRIQN